VVISGVNQNLMGIQDTMSKTSVIDARGLTPRDVREEIERRLQ
jgi:hypothetical protein